MHESSRKPRPDSDPVWVFGRPSHLPARLGRYLLMRVLGAGGMGAVYLAHDSQLDRRVALKLPDVTDVDRPQIDRFLRETKIAATLHHPNLCPVYDAGQIDGIYYLTMPVLEGQPLTAYLGKPMAPQSAVRIVRKIARALQSAHDSGIVHRDLKPSNVMMMGADHLMVMDFGLALRTEATEKQHLTRDGHVVGTPAYMAPEQVRGKPEQIGPRTDVYALGVILYELLTGRLPFEGTFAGLVVQIAYEPAKPLREINPAIPAELADVVAIALAKKPEERYASMRAFANALKEAAGGRSGEAPLPAAAPGKQAGGSETRPVAVVSPTPIERPAIERATAEPDKNARPPKPRRRTFRRRRGADVEWAIGILLKAVIVAVALGVLYFGGGFLLEFAETQGVASALRTLQTAPGDANALAKVRSFADTTKTKQWSVHRDAAVHLCVEANDWPRALRLFERCADPALCAAAKRDLLEPQATVDIEACADGWYDVAQRESGKVKDRFLCRARDWYEKAVGRLGGAAADRIKNRIAEAPAKP